MRTFLRDNGLTVVLAAMFLFSLGGMILSGWSSHNEELALHGTAPIGIGPYVYSADFLSAVFENWESEFLQMSAYVMLTAMLFQRGSAESRDPDDPSRKNDEAPLGMRGHSPILAWLHSYSLRLALALLFLASFGIHWWLSFMAANEEALRHGGEARTALAHLVDPKLWSESFQNWQSEFLSTAVLVVLSIMLRHKGSPESKPVGATNAQTGG